MYQVSTFNLSRDARQAAPAFGAVDLGAIAAPDLLALLERFRGLDAAQNQLAEPHLVITGHSGKFHVRTGQGKLFLYNARDTVEPYAELTPPEILVQLERATVTVAPFLLSGESPVSSASLRVRPAPRRALAASLLVASLALNGYTLYSAFYTERVEERPAVVLVTDQAEAAARRREIAGTYATGTRPGDRVIVVRADGRVEFSEVGITGRINANTDTYQLGRHGAKFRLSTHDSGVVDVLNLETLVYYRDTYRR